MDRGRALHVAAGDAGGSHPHTVLVLLRALGPLQRHPGAVIWGSGFEHIWGYFFEGANQRESRRFEGFHFPVSSNSVRGWTNHTELRDKNELVKVSLGWL